MTHNDSKTETSPNAYWEREYSQGGIPSSVRGDPSGSVVDFIAFLAARGVTTGRAIDVGCGTGRNALYLAEKGFDVVAIDYARPQIVELNKQARRDGLENLLRAEVADVRQKWPVADASVDVGVDAFCFKHQISPSDVDGYIQAASTAVRTGGFLMISFAGRNDGYYSQFPIADTAGVGQIISDPGNNILSRLYEPDEVARLFTKFEIVETLVKRNANQMHGREYPRETHILYLRRS